MNKTLILGDCYTKSQEKLKDNFLSAIIQDVPYGLKFMNNKWDSQVPDVKIFKEQLRVLKPGGFLVSICGDVTQHRMVCNIEDAGFNIRKGMIWAYGSGVPHGLDVGKTLKDWRGYNTQIKTAFEWICLAQKPIEGKFIDNIKKWHCGALNVDACRTPYDYEREIDKRITTPEKNVSRGKHSEGTIAYAPNGNLQKMYKPEKGRYPTNLLDGGILEEIIGEKSRYFKRIPYNPKVSVKERELGCEHLPTQKLDHSRKKKIDNPHNRSTERHNFHPTVKPLQLMYWLVKLVTPPRRFEPIVADYYAGSGSTLIACKILGVDCVGFEIIPEYVRIAEARLKVPVLSWQKFIDEEIIDWEKQKTL